MIFLFSYSVNKRDMNLIYKALKGVFSLFSFFLPKVRNFLRVFNSILIIIHWSNPNQFLHWGLILSWTPITFPAVISLCWHHYNELQVDHEADVVWTGTVQEKLYVLQIWNCVHKLISFPLNQIRPLGYLFCVSGPAVSYGWDGSDSPFV